MAIALLPGAPAGVEIATRTAVQIVIFEAEILQDRLVHIEDGGGSLARAWHEARVFEARALRQHDAVGLRAADAVGGIGDEGVPRLTRDRIGFGRAVEILHPCEFGVGCEWWGCGAVVADGDDAAG